MTVDQAISDISALSPLDQLRVVQAIQDRLPAEIGTALSSSQRDELNRRWDEYKNDPSSVLSEEEFREQVAYGKSTSA